MRTRTSGLARQEATYGLLFVAPWVVGFVLWVAGPMLASFALVFTEWQILSPPKFVGLENVRTLLEDRFVGIALYNTAYFTFLYVPLNLAVALGLALLVNRQTGGIAAIRTLFYLPSVTPTVAYTALWIWLLNADYGLINLLLRQVGVKGPRWLGDPDWAKLALILMSLWGFGSVALIFLAALQGVPETLYEAAALDGAGRLAKFWNVTLPMISPAILFNLVIGMINSFQIFTSAYVIAQGGTPGGPANSTLFLVIYLYNAGFHDFQMGYASTLAWLLFLIVLVLTGLQFVGSRRWVHYETGGPGSP
ncbi:MAG TPA: sugar ABC transporter permease [Chloroflexota bacterium]|nr:sugar ABC transporter permease [Chloroflexota bacterium]